jgi:3-oxoacyl-[acyl-carrier-protein] synthase III
MGVAGPAGARSSEHSGSRRGKQPSRNAGVQRQHRLCSAPHSRQPSSLGSRDYPVAAWRVLMGLAMKRTWNDVRLLSWATELPEEVLTSAAIEERMAVLFERAGLERGVLAAKTGVVERRLYGANEDPEFIAARVARQALARAEVSPADVGAIYSASIDHRYFEPSAAHFVARTLGGAPRAQLLDVRNACMGFIDALSLAADRIEAGAVEVAVVVAAEAGGMRRSIEESISHALRRGRLEPEDWVPLTMGCGAVAWVLGSATRFRGLASLDAFLTHNQSEHAMVCSGRIEDDGTLRVSANGPAILRFGVPLVARALEGSCRSGRAMAPRIPENPGAAPACRAGPRRSPARSSPGQPAGAARGSLHWRWREPRALHVPEDRSAGARASGRGTAGWPRTWRGRLRRRRAASSPGGGAQGAGAPAAWPHAPRGSGAVASGVAPRAGGRAAPRPASVVSASHQSLPRGHDGASALVPFGAHVRAACAGAR